MKMAVSLWYRIIYYLCWFTKCWHHCENDSTLVTLGHLTKGPVLLAIFGIAITIILYARKVPGSIFIGMIITAIVGMITGLIHTPSGVVGKIPSITPTFGATF